MLNTKHTPVYPSHLEADRLIAPSANYHSASPLLRRVILESHCSAVEGAAVVAPERQQAAAIALTRHLAPTVLKTRVHDCAIGAEGETCRLVVQVLWIVCLEDGIALALAVDRVNTGSPVEKSNG